MKVKTFSFFSGLILLFSPGACHFNLVKNDKVNESSNFSIAINSEGYTSITNFDENFIAAGSDGRIDIISGSGKVIKSTPFSGETFNSIITIGSVIIAGGNNGVLRISTNGESFHKVVTGTNKNINSLAAFNELIIAASDDGVIFSGPSNGPFTEKQLNLKGNILSVSARVTDCFGVTSEGEIIRTTDGINWSIVDFNKLYAGFYKPCSFTEVLVTENRIAVAGIHDDGTTVLLFSTQGGVWTERTLNYTDEQGIDILLSGMPADIEYDIETDRFYLACSNGKMLEIPSCTHCNEYVVFPGAEIKSISINEGTLLIAGSRFYLKTIILR